MKKKSWKKDYNIIHSTFKHGNNFRMDYFNVVHENVNVGNNCRIRSHVDLRPYTLIGNDVYIDSFVASSGLNTIGNNVTIRYGSIIAKNVIIKDNVFIAPRVGFINISFIDRKKETTVIEDNVKIGMGSIIGKNVRIKEGTIIGALSFVRKSITEKGVYAGNPLRRIR